jgi:indole-3-glycerol phosphate synthase
MGVLDQIVAHKATEVAERKELYPIKLLEQSPYFSTKSVSLKHYLTRPSSSGVIAEFKRRSPSKGDINPHASIEKLSIGYMQAGAAALSILTDKKFFGGSNDDLTAARKSNFCPILRKEFIIDEYQVIEAKSIGADVILLIARILTAEKLKALADLAVKLGLEVLCEVHEEKELERSLVDSVTHLGINSRNLDTLSIDPEAFERLGALVPAGKIRVAESGISSPDVISSLRKSGFSGFLIGENFMKTADPAKACARFIEQARVQDEQIDILNG